MQSGDQWWWRDENGRYGNAYDGKTEDSNALRRESSSPAGEGNSSPAQESADGGKPGTTATDVSVKSASKGADVRSSIDSKGSTVSTVSAGSQR